MSLQKIIKSFLLTALSLYLTALIIPGFSISQGLGNILIATLALTLLNIFIRPIIRLLLLPVNIVTLGAFRWLANIIILYLLILLLPAVTLSNFLLSGIPLLGSILPGITIGKFVGTILVSIVLSFSQGILLWLIK